MTENQEFTSPTGETKPLSSGSMLVKIFSEPSAIFQSIKAKSSWLIPILLIFVIAIVSGYVSFPYQMEMQLQAMEQNENVSQEQLEATRQGMEQAKGSPIIAAIGAVVQGIMFLVMILIGAALYMLMGTVFLGGSATFAQVFSVSAWSTIPMLIGMIIKLPLIVSKETLDVRTSLAILMPDTPLTDTMVAVLNALTDIFMIWGLVLAIIGISIVYNYTKGKAAAVVLVPAIVLIGIGIGLSKAFGG